MTREEARQFGLNLLHGIVERNKVPDPRYADNVKQAIDALLAPSLPSNLDEAAEEEANKYGNEYFQFRSWLRACFKAGAEWMAGQGYTKEETVYFERLCDENRIMVDLGWGEPERGGFNPGDKVIVQIRKKQ